MVAYSFKRRFVSPIKVGLGKWFRQVDGIAPPPKRQTIRAVSLKRHARPGEELQLYHAQRTRQCFLIGRAQCVSVEDIVIRFHKKGRHDWLRVGKLKLDRPDQLDAFARGDGFYDWAALREFWLEEHGDLRTFNGVIIKWQPLDTGDHYHEQTTSTRRAPRRDDERDASEGA